MPGFPTRQPPQNGPQGACVTVSPAGALLILILAHDEAAVIGDTVRSLIPGLAPRDRLVIVADNCSDDTAGQAARAGAQVVIRESGKPDGKGKALAWYLDQQRAELASFAMIVILDADSQTEAEFLPNIRSGLGTHSLALQCFVYPLCASAAPIGRLAALSELIDQRVGDRLRAVLRWPVRLRGTGMVIQPALLIEVGPELDTAVEDIALSLLLAARGVQIDRLDSAMVIDPKPASASAASIQRARWFRGQFQAAWRYRREIGRILLAGPGGWSLLSSLFLRPKWLMLALSGLAALIFRNVPLVAIFFSAYFVIGVSYLAIGLVLIPERGTFAGVLLHAPAYVLMWLKGISLSLRSSLWHRAREP